MSGESDPALLYQGLTVAELQAAALTRFADRTILVAGEERYSCSDLDAKIAQYVRLFKAHGLQRGDGFSILASNRLEAIFANMAGQVLGLRYSPLHPKGSEEDHLYILDHAQISALLVDDRHFGERGRAIEAKAKLSQNRPAADIDGVVAGARARGDEAMARAVGDARAR